MKHFLPRILLIFYVFPICLNTANVEAADSLTLVNTPPPQAVEEDYYSWQIPVKGGTAPYRFSYSGEIPRGLNLGFTGSIYGIPERGLSRSSYQVTIKVDDSSFPQMHAEQVYTFIVMYKTDIEIVGTQFAGETNVYIDGSYAGKLQGSDSMTKFFPSGEYHRISVDYEVIDPTDNNTRYVFKNRYIRVSGSSPSAEFACITEYHIEAVTEPKYVSNSLSSDFYSLSQWYEKGSTLSYSVPPQIQASNDTQYRFSHWSLPPWSQRQIDNKLMWIVNNSGEIIANYDTYFRLTISSDYGGDIKGEGFYKAGDEAKWIIRYYNPPSASGFLGLLGIKLRPVSMEGTIVMDSPQKLRLIWEADPSSVTGPILCFIIGGLIVLGIEEYLRRHKKQ